MLNTVICDDNPDSNYILTEYIKQINIPQIKILNTFEDGYSLINFCNKFKVDLILLDVNMPIINGIETGKEILKILPDVSIILLTGSAEYSMQAFEIHAIDYLIKPISPDTLKKSLGYIVKKFSEPNKDTSSFSPNNTHVTFSTKSSTYSIRQGELIFAERVGRKTLLHTTDTTLEIYESLKNLENRLDKKSFIRTHNSYLVNKSAIFKIEKSKSGIGKVFLKDTDKIAYISRSHRTDINTDTDIENPSY